MPNEQPFDQSAWRQRVAAWWEETAQDLQGTMRRLGLRTAYGTLAASAWLPLLAAYSDDPGAATVALVGLVGGVGSNLVANLVQGTYERGTALGQTERELAERPDLRPAYQQMLNSLNALDAAQAALGENWAAFEKRLRDELELMGGGLRIESGGGAVVLGNVQVRDGGIFIGRDQNIEQHYHLEKRADTTKLRAVYLAYLRQLAERHGRLPLRGVDVRAGDPGARAQRPRLAQVYVHLNTTTRLAAEKGQESPALPEALRREGQETRPLGALQAALDNRRVVLLGAPGSGKSTFVGHLAFCLAMARLEPGGGWLDLLPGWSASDALPVVIILRDLARWAAARSRKRGALELGAARTISDFIAYWLDKCDLGDFVAPLQRALRGGHALLLLDGLDEVPTRELRALVRDAVQDFARTYQEARLLITCRVLSYQDPAWQLDAERFSAFELADLDQEQVDGFIGAWYRELGDLGEVLPEQVDALSARLRQAVRRPDLRRLAPNPLLLTVMALVHAHTGRLPHARALLYEECSDMLLWRWEQQKLASEQEASAGLRALLDQARLQAMDLKGVLRALAFEAHAATGSQDDEATADIPQHRLLEALRELHPQRSLDWAESVVQQIKERAGLLVERDTGVYAFPHRTFQEYLAGAHLSTQADFAERAAGLSQEAAFWRQVILLAVGREVHVSESLAGPLALVAELCPSAAPRDEQGWLAAWLAGEVLLEAGVERVNRSRQGQDLLERARQRLAALLEGDQLSPRQRAEAGDVLGQLGDPRRGVSPLPLGEGADRERSAPDFLWVEIPPGSFMMGSREDDREASGDERPQQRLDLDYRYWIARYPTTVAQYACFVRDGGYNKPDYWTSDGWAWRQGTYDSQVKEDWLREYLRQRPAELRGAPFRWDEQQQTPNRPIMNVTWFEAVAYCRWLEREARGEGRERWGVWRGGRVEPFARPSSYKVVIRLPTEAEWEKAARGSQANHYPWGNVDWEPGRANIRQSGIGHPTPVGMYPQGATPTGLLDMAGNVWEWTASLYQPYPYRPGDGRDDPDADGRRVVRGGAWGNYLGGARCASRSGARPIVGTSVWGFAWRRPWLSFSEF